MSYSVAVSAADLLKLLMIKKYLAITLLLLLKLPENTITSSTEKQSSSAIIVHKPKRTATSTRTTRTRQNNPYRLGAAPAGVVGARSRCCSAATVPAAVVFACGVCCCIADNKQIVRIKPSNDKQSSAIIVHKQTKRTATSTITTRRRQNNPYRLGAAPAGVVGARSRCCPPATVPAAVVFACGVCCCIADIKQIVRIKPSTEKQSSAIIIVHKPKRTATSTRTIHTRQNKPYGLGAVRAGVVGARSRCCLSLIHI